MKSINGALRLSKLSLTSPLPRTFKHTEVVGSQDWKEGLNYAGLRSGLRSLTLGFHVPVFFCPFSHLVPKCQDVMTGPASLATVTIVLEPMVTYQAFHISGLVVCDKYACADENNRTA